MKYQYYCMFKGTRNPNRRRTRAPPPNYWQNHTQTQRIHRTLAHSYTDQSNSWAVEYVIYGNEL